MKAQQTEINQYSKRLDFATALARKVGREALRFWQENGTDNLGTTSKGLQDFVTRADQEAEDTIRHALAQKFPEDGFIGEESGGETGNAGYWVVDPIDGTANYLRGLRHWGVSIAYVEGDKAIVGVIHDSATDRIYSAQADKGARRDGEIIQVSATANPHMATGIMGVSRRTSFETYLKQLRALNDAGIEHRRIGSAAIGIVRVAEGVADFYYEKHLNCWDAMAALLIAQEAGARIVAPVMGSFIPEGGEVFCATPKLFDQLEGLLLKVE
ncbi:Inositol-1-monophosphatase [hydrothermal vent metagenome]|uniref:Inositol-1-monophosphatase n=1 Tax=hydrothermal vent metagenome TaxID=652676 RepID=A0A3B0TZF4_9ZZZZ